MTEKQERLVSRNAYKFYDKVVYENQDWNKRDIALASFCAGAEYALKNKYDELKENNKPNIVQFLQENGVYDMFWDNLANQKTQEEIIHCMKYYFGAVNAISAAFTWSCTPEGHTFWEELSERWNKQF